MANLPSFPFTCGVSLVEEMWVEGSSRRGALL